VKQQEILPDGCESCSPLSGIFILQDVIPPDRQTVIGARIFLFTFSVAFKNEL
jgi:hypothetical protein